MILISEHITPVMYVDPSGHIAIELAIVIVAIVVVVAIAVTYLTILMLQSIAGDITIKNPLENFPTHEDIYKYLKKISQGIILGIAASIATIKNFQETNAGTYVLQFQEGTKTMYYVGKGNKFRAAISAGFQLFQHPNAKLTGYMYFPASNDREAFKQEYILMCEFGFHTKKSRLYNIIWSPGRKYYYKDHGYYYVNDPGW